MKKVELKISFSEYENANELSSIEQELVKKATDACDSAYAPYSDFHVGAALLLDNGTIITGNNQENVAYPSALCAERVAIYYAGSQYPNVAVKTVAITCKSDTVHLTEPLSPCGACRQAMAEYETRHNSKIKVILVGDNNKIIVVDSVADLLPFMFKAEELKKSQH